MAKKPLDASIVPPIDNGMVDRIYTYLKDNHDIKRPPEVASRLLALLVELHYRDQPYPPRALVAQVIGASPFGLDAAINRALEREQIRTEIRTASGSISARTSVVQHKHYIPSQELLDAANPPRHGKPKQLQRRRVA